MTYTIINNKQDVNLMQDLVIVGAGGFGREVAWLVVEINCRKPAWNLLGYIDADREKWGQVRSGYPVDPRGR